MNTGYIGNQFQEQWRGRLHRFLEKDENAAKKAPGWTRGHFV
jgi:hypothetical protein